MGETRRLERHDRFSPLLYGIVAAGGAYGLTRLGVWLVVQIPLEAGAPSIQDTDDYLQWLGGQGPTILLRMLAVLVLGSTIGWLVTPWLVGQVMGWRRLAPTLGYQLMLGFLAVPFGLWLYDRSAAWGSEPRSIVGWTLLLGVGVGVPALARLAAMRERVPPISPATDRPPDR